MNLNGDGGAESYEGVSIEWIRGHDPIMTVYDDGIEQEAIDLTKIGTIPEMHQMMMDKGFIKKRIDEEKEAIKKGVEEETIFAKEKGEKEKTLSKNGTQKKIFAEVAVEKEEVDYLQSEVKRQERIAEAGFKKGNQLRLNDDGWVVEPHKPINYIFMISAILSATLVILRYRKRRRSRRHTV